MQSKAADGDVLVDSRRDTMCHAMAPSAALIDADGELGIDSYFNLAAQRHDGGSSSSSVRSLPLSMVEPEDMVAPALAALQYLPVPLVVLSSQKTVILANE